jgi:hypothetical protein
VCCRCGVLGVIMRVVVVHILRVLKLDVMLLILKIGHVH